MNRLLIVLSLLPAIAGKVGASPHSTDFESWFGGDLVPYVRQQLTTLPRFRGESFRFVVMNDDSPQSQGSALVLDLRDRLRDAIANEAGVHVVWLAGQPGIGLATDSSGLDCTRNHADYFIGMQLEAMTPGQVRVTVKALDTAEHAWVAGFSRVWQVAVTSRQRRQLHKIVADPGFRGKRDAPWNDTETDLMAANLAYELGCKLLKQMDGKYVVAASNIHGNLTTSTPLVELVSNNLAGSHALQFSDANTNAVIEGKANRIDANLYQYWISIQPTGEASGMSVLSANAYVRIPDKHTAAMLLPDATYELQASTSGFLTSFGIVRMSDRRACPGGSQMYSTAASSRQRNGDCFALQARSADDAVLFFLNHQLQNGLVRLANENCARSSLAKVVRINETVKMPLPLDSMHSAKWTAGESWSSNPRADTYLVIAASDSSAARALSKHIESLPKRCSAAVRPGLEGDELRRWLAGLDAIVEHWTPAVDWKSVHVKEVY